MFCTVAEYILTFGRVPRQPRIISRSELSRAMEVLLPLLDCLLTVQVISLIYTALLFLRVSKYFPHLFYTLRTPGLVWMSPYLVATYDYWLLMSTIIIEVVGIMLVMVINLVKERVEGKGRVNNEDDGKQVDREGMTGWGAYTVRETKGGWKRGWWSSGQNFVI